MGQRVAENEWLGSLRNVFCLASHLSGVQIDSSPETGKKVHAQQSIDERP
jgi:hypothetical protein